MSSFDVAGDDEDRAPLRGELEVLTGELVQFDQASRGHRGQKSTGEDFRFNDHKKQMYLELLRQGIRRRKAASYCGVSYATVVLHMKRFPEFADAVDEAEEVRLDEVEEAMFETAIAGNVTAQQVILYNRRGEEWADQRMMRARLEAAAADAESKDRRAAETAREGLLEKLGELRSRLEDDGTIVPDMAETDDAGDDEPAYVEAILVEDGDDDGEEA